MSRSEYDYLPVRREIDGKTFVIQPGEDNRIIRVTEIGRRYDERIMVIDSANGPAITVNGRLHPLLPLYDAK